MPSVLTEFSINIPSNEPSKINANDATNIPALLPTYGTDIPTLYTDIPTMNNVYR